MRRVRDALTNLLGAVPGGTLRPVDLQRALKIGQKLSWQLFTTVDVEDPLSAAPYVPGPSAMRSFLRAAERKDLPSALIHAAGAAVEEFEQFVETYAGDRVAFEAMISAWSNDTRQKFFHSQQKAAFRANSMILGMQAGVQLICYLFYPSKTKSLLDRVSICGYLGLQRFRTDAACVISRSRSADSDGVIRRRVDREPLDPTGDASHGIGLLREFCSEPLSTIRTATTESGYVRAELVGDEVGMKSAATCLVGHVARQFASQYRDEHNPFGQLCAEVRMPCEALIVDILVGEGVFGPIKPEISVYGEHESGPAFGEGGQRPKLAMQETVTPLGRGLSAVQTRDVPRYPEMCQYACDKMGWPGERFEVYRCRVSYPVCPSTTVMRFDLPAAPADQLHDSIFQAGGGGTSQPGMHDRLGGSRPA